MKYKHMNDRNFRHPGKIRRVLLSLTLAFSLLANGTVPAAADTGSKEPVVASVISSIGSTLEKFFDTFLSLFSGQNTGDGDTSLTATDGTDDYPTMAPVTVASPEAALGDVDDENGTFTVMAVNVPEGSAAAGYFSDADVNTDEISVAFRISFGDDTDDARDYEAESNTDGSYKAVCDMADFGFSTGSYHVSVLLKAGDDEAQLAETDVDVDLQNFLYVAVPEDGYGNAEIYVVNPTLEDGSEATEVRFLLTLRESQDEEDTSATPNQGAVLTKLSVKEDNQASSETVSSQSTSTSDTEENEEENPSTDRSDTDGSYTDSSDTDSSDMDNADTDGLSGNAKEKTEIKSETETETIAIRKLSNPDGSDSGITSTLAEISDTCNDGETETSTETATDFLSTVDLTQNNGETVVDAEEIADGVWMASVSASDLDDGGTYTVEAYVGSSEPDNADIKNDNSTDSEELPGTQRGASTDADLSNMRDDVTSDSEELPDTRYKDASDDTDSSAQQSQEISDNAVSIGTAAFTLWLRDSASVEVPEMLQNPELPTGCESVALTIALNSLGFDLDKTTIADDYLVMGTNFASSYVGNPFTSHGSGIFAPGLTDTANAFLEDQNSSYTATDITGTDFDDLLSYIDEGVPVVLWTTMYMSSVSFTGNNVTYEGKTYRWYNTEHCVVLCGYDRTNGTVLVSDPLSGIVTRDWDAFADIYETAGENAMIIS